MEIPIADMSYKRRNQSDLLDVFLRLVDEVREFRYRNAVYQSNITTILSFTFTNKLWWF